MFLLSIDLPPTFFLLGANIFQAIILPKLNGCPVLFPVCIRGSSLRALFHTVTRVPFVEYKSDFVSLLFEILSVSLLPLDKAQSTACNTFLYLTGACISSPQVCCRSLFLTVEIHTLIHSFFLQQLLLIFPSLCLLKSDIVCQVFGQGLVFAFLELFYCTAKLLNLCPLYDSHTQCLTFPLCL